MVVSIGTISSAAQGVSYFERDGYYARDDPQHREVSAWAGKGAEALGLSGPVDADTFKDVLDGTVPDGSGRRLGRPGKDGSLVHRPGRDLTFSAPKSVSLVALLGDDAAVAAAHDKAVKRTLAWLEETTIQTRMKDPETGRLSHVGGQKMVAATFRHDTSRNLDPQLHTHAVIANMVLGEDGGTPRSGKWRTMANESLYRRQKLIGMVYRSELAQELQALGYAIEKTHADGRFEIAGVSRGVIDAFSTRRAEIEAAMNARGLGDPASNPHLAERAALMTRAHKRDVDREVLRESWREQAASLGFSPERVTGAARERREMGPVGPAQAERSSGEKEAPGNRDRETDRRDALQHRQDLAAVSWATEHLSEREAVFTRSDLLASSLAWKPGSVSVEGVDRAIDSLQREGRLHTAPGLLGGDGMTTDTALADERETIGLMTKGKDQGRVLMRNRRVRQHLHKGALTEGQKEAVATILSSKDRVVGVQGYAGTGKTTMLSRARVLAEKKRLSHAGPGAFGLGREDALGRGRHRERNPAALPGAQRRRRRRKAHRTRQARHAGRVLEDGAGGGRRLAGVDRAGTGPAPDRQDAGRAPCRPGRRREAIGCGGCRQAVRPIAGSGHADGGDGRDHASARSGTEGGGGSESRGRYTRRLRETGLQRGGGAAGQHRRRRGCAVAQALAGAAREHRGDGAEPRAATGHQRTHQGEACARRRDPWPGLAERTGSCRRGYTGAEKALAANYAPGDVVAFHRPYKRIGVQKGDERRVVEIDHRNRVVMLEGRNGGTVAWRPNEIAGRTGGAEVYRTEEIELRAGDRVRWTRNDRKLKLVNSRAAEVVAVNEDRVSFRLEDGRVLDLDGKQTQLRHVDHAWASTVHAFQGRTVDNVIAAMEANHPHLTTQKSLYVEISPGARSRRAGDRRRGATAGTA